MTGYIFVSFDTFYIFNYFLLNVHCFYIRNHNNQPNCINKAGSVGPALFDILEFVDYFITVTIIKQIAINTLITPVAYRKGFNLFPKFSTESSLLFFNRYITLINMAISTTRNNPANISGINTSNPIKASVKFQFI